MVPHSVISGAATIDRETVSALQEFDVLIQSLDALSSFMEQFAKALPAEQMIDVRAALKVVHLGTVSDRLAGRFTESSDKSNNASEPNSQLF